MARSRPFVSVIVPTHNRSSLLREALASVVAQAGRGQLFDLETIVVDDASTDDTPEVVAQFAARYVRHPTNRGLSAARNTGIAAARGRYVAFLDDDDVWLPNRLLVQVPVIESHPEVDLVYSTYLASLDGAPLPFDDRPRPSGDVFAKLLMDNFVGNVLAVLIRRTALERVGGFQAAGLEDYDLWLRLARDSPFLFVPGPVAVYRVSSRGMWRRLNATGQSRAQLRGIVTTALARAPALSREFRQVVIEEVELRNFRNLLGMRGLSDADRSSQLLAHLAEYPRLAEHPEVCGALARFARLTLARSPAPLEAVAAFCDGIGRSCGATRHTSRLRAQVWAELAIASLLTGHLRRALRATVRALRDEPTQLAVRVWAVGVGWIRSRPARPRKEPEAGEVEGPFGA